MNKKERLAEKYAKLHGWEKVKGYKFDTSWIEDDWEEVYLTKEVLDDNLSKCVFWQYTIAEENIEEDVWDVIEYIEDHLDVPDFDEFRKADKQGDKDGR